MVTPQTHVGQTVPQHLIIVASSQKGLCGTFNTTLFKFFEPRFPKSRIISTLLSANMPLITCSSTNKTSLLHIHNFSAHHFVTIAQAITAMIVQNPELYTMVTVYSNYQKSFFVQRPRKSIIYPLAEIEKLHNKRKTYRISF